MSFSFRDRESALASLSSRRPDLVVIGGGVVGSSIAAHAARLGLDVLLLEKEDIAAGASGNSTGLAHAGLRYLAQGRVGYVFREGRERRRLEDIAPQWVQPFNFLLPVYREDPYPFWMVRLGTLLYDALGWADAVMTRRPLTRRHRVLSAEDIKMKMPGIRTDGLRGGIEYFVDARLQDTRFTLGYAQLAAQHGARIITHCQVTSISTTNTAGPRIACQDRLSGLAYDFTCALVINAAGPWIDEVRQTAGQGGNLVQKSKGVHLVVDHLVDSPIIASSAARGRVFFVIPIDSERSLVGTTDTAVISGVDDVQPEARDVLELLQQLFYLFPYVKQGANLKEAVENYQRVHVRDIFWGVRPLLDDGVPTAAATREHRLVKENPCLWSFPGVKLTAGRAAGEEAAIEAWNYIRAGVPLPAVTWGPLPGGDLADVPSYVRYAQQRFKLGDQSEALIPYLVSMYGTRFVELVQWAQREPHYMDPVLAGKPWILAQAAYAVHEEMVLTLNDFLWRRTKWAHWRDLPEEAVRRIAETLGYHLGWKAAQVQKEILEYQKELKKHRLS